MSRIGLVAGEGKLPIVFAKEAKRKGDEVIAFGLKGVTSPDLERHVDRMHWFEWGQLKKAIFTGVTERVKKIVWLGKIDKKLVLAHEHEFDEKAREVAGSLKDKNDYSILKTVGSLLKTVGIEVLDSTTYLQDLVPRKGVLTRRSPTAEEEKDIEKGRVVATELARLDIGQAVCVKSGCVIALEGTEGTDETIRRAGTLSGGGFTVVKVARPDQDMRFDVPLVGPDTVEAVIAAKGAVLALEEKRTILMDRDEVVALADNADVAITII